MAQLRSKSVIAVIVLVALLIIVVPLSLKKARTASELFVIPTVPDTPSPNQLYSIVQETHRSLR